MIADQWCSAALGIALALAGCSEDAVPQRDEPTSSGEDASSTDSTGAGTAESDSSGASDPTATVDESGSESDSTDSESSGSGGEVGSCQAAIALEGTVDCPLPTATDYEAAIEWEWNGGDGLFGVGTTPLVANLTDDNDDGVIDLCDTPDLVVIASDHIPPGPEPRGVMIALDGATGAVHWQAALDFAQRVEPALGDIDGDGLVEIVAVRNDHPTMAYDGPQSLVAVSNTGEVEWTRQYTTNGSTLRTSISLADLDGDGDVEIVLGQVVFDHEGGIEAVLADPVTYALDHSAVADVDQDGDLEVVTGPAGVVHHDGVVLLPPPDELPVGYFDDAIGFHQVADFDGDGEPEVLFQGFGELVVYELDGAILMQRELGVYAPDANPVSADFDGDGRPEIAVGDEPNIAVYRTDGSLVFASDVWTGLSLPLLSEFTARATAFDFLGQGRDQLVVNDGFALRLYDDGFEVLEVSQEVSGGGSPVIADIDNDGSAEIVVTSNPANAETFSVRVVGAATGDWARARRIFNQAGYSVANVLEDGTIPTQAPTAWSLGIGYGGQVRVDEGGAVCTVPR